MTRYWGIFSLCHTENFCCGIHLCPKHSNMYLLVGHTEVICLSQAVPGLSACYENYTLPRFLHVCNTLVHSFPKLAAFGFCLGSGSGSFLFSVLRERISWLFVGLSPECWVETLLPTASTHLLLPCQLTLAKEFSSERGGSSKDDSKIIALQSEISSDFVPFLPFCQVPLKPERQKNLFSFAQIPW